MNKTKIEWCDYSINPVKGLCPKACSFCYARRMYKRFKWNPEIRFEDVFDLPQKPSRIFIGSTMELFGDWIKPEWMQSIFADIRYYPQHTFIFLTKQPQNLIKWSPFPENCWIGVTATDTKQYWEALSELQYIKAKVKFLSLEPLLGKIKSLLSSLEYSLNKAGINQLIIGQRTPISAKTQPKIEWIQEIVKAADKARVPIFLKDNLRPIIETLSVIEALPFYDTQGCDLRQEFPSGIVH